MKEIIKRILSECEYSNITTEELSYHTKEEKSYFFIVNISEADFSTFRSKEIIKENEQYNNVLDEFTKITNNGDRITIEKNSSLLVLVKCASIEATNSLQQQILLLEEDEYFFKKYVIVYTDDSISELNVNPIIPLLRTKINSIDVFNRFATVGCKDEIAEYFTVMELFIKLPFLSINEDAEGYIALGQKIRDVLDTDQSLYLDLLSNAENLGQVNFSKPEDEVVINELLSILSHD